MDPGVINSLVPIFGILLVMIPVAGITLALTLRLAVKPFVETMATALRESGHGAVNQQLGSQMLMLQEELESLTKEMRELRSGQEFDQRLLASSGEPAVGER